MQARPRMIPAGPRMIETGFLGPAIDECKELTTDECRNAVGGLLEKYSLTQLAAALFINIGDFSLYNCLDAAYELVAAAKDEEET